MAIHRNGVVSHVGVTLGYSHETWNDSMHIASKFALVWDEDTLAPKSVFVCDDYGNSGHFEADATASVQAAYQAYCDNVREMQRLADEEREFNRVEKGKFVEVHKGRKVAKGTRGQVFWSGVNQWGESCGIITATGEKHFTALTNVRVVIASPEELETVATRQAESKAKWLASNPQRTRTNDYSVNSVSSYRRRAHYGHIRY
jgi:hypothetical protein